MLYSTYVTVDSGTGRLGNQLFHYCACRYFAKKFNCEFLFPDNWLGKGLINCDLGISPSKIHVNDDKILLSGTFQNLDHVDKSYFSANQFKEEEEILIKYPTNNFCYIHFRGTDHSGPHCGDLAQMIPKSYFVAAKQRMLDINPNMKFLVITDDIEKAKRYVDAEDYLSNNTFIDFKLLMRSKYTIISNSTFSWWTSYLNNDKVFCIAPCYWRWVGDVHLSKSSHIDLVL